MTEYEPGMRVVRASEPYSDEMLTGTVRDTSNNASAMMLEVDWDDGTSTWQHYLHLRTVYNATMVSDDGENYREPEGMSFEDSMALKYPLIDQEYPFHE